MRRLARVVRPVVCSRRRSDVAAGRSAAENAPANLAAGDLAMVLQKTDGGVALTSLVDTAAKQELLAAKPLPLVELTLRNVKTKQEVRLAADDGWGQIDIQNDPAGGLTIRWATAQGQRAGRLRTAGDRPRDPRAREVGHPLDARGGQPGRRVERLASRLPAGGAGRPGAGAEVFFPRGAAR